MESVRRRTSDHSDVSGGVHRRDSVSRLLLTLPRWERDAVTLAYFGGFTYGEVAWLLQQPEGVVKSWIRSGLARLRMELDAAADDVTTRPSDYEPAGDAIAAPNGR